jgi:hypothetical protein
MLLDIIKTVLGLGTGALRKRQRLKEIELEARSRIVKARADAEIDRITSGPDANADWDLEVARQMQHTWKDEYLTIILSLPLIIAFLGEWGRTTVANGFAAISEAPEWYKIAFLAVIAASFGLRVLVQRVGLVWPHPPQKDNH